MNETDDDEDFQPDISDTDVKFISLFKIDDDTPTGIIAINAADIAKTVISDLSGRRVSKPSRGIYIVNGKKVLIK